MYLDVVHMGLGTRLNVKGPIHGRFGFGALRRTTLDRELQNSLYNKKRGVEWIQKKPDEQARRAQLLANEADHRKENGESGNDEADSDATPPSSSEAKPEEKENTWGGIRGT